MSQDCTVQAASRAVADMTNAGRPYVVQKWCCIPFSSFLESACVKWRGEILVGGALCATPGKHSQTGLVTGNYLAPRNFFDSTFYQFLQRGRHHADAPVWPNVCASRC